MANNYKKVQSLKPLALGARMETAILSRPMAAMNRQGNLRMSWITRWRDKRSVRDLKRRISQMKIQLDEVEADLHMPTLETMSGRILQERIELLEKAVEKLESHPGTVDE